MHSALVAVALFAFYTAVAPAQATQARPNVVLIITDDMGSGDVGVYGSKDIKTPNIDRLARQGVRLTEFYANAPWCTPTRAGLITGRYQQRYGLEVPLPSEIPAQGRGLRADGKTLPRLMKNAGYVTALVGKWHLGYQPDMTPMAHGFDYFYGLRSGYHDFYTHRGSDQKLDLYENDRLIDTLAYTTDLITARAKWFIEQNATKRFFIDVAFNAPHWPYQPPDSPSVAPSNAAHFKATDSLASRRSDYVRMVERVDAGVGELLATLDRLGLRENTIVIFTNDNGGEWLADNGPFFGRKGTVWEGGLRVPAIVRWPARIPAGKVSQQVGITMDLTASILAAAGASAAPDAPMEGIDLFPILAGRAPEVSRTLFWRTNYDDIKQKAVRSGDWKLLYDGRHQYVFNVKTDIGERRDLAKERQDVARRLRLLIDAWEREIQ